MDPDILSRHCGCSDPLDQVAGAPLNPAPTKLRPLARLNRFDAHRTALQPAHKRDVAAAAAQIVRSRVSPFPIRLVHVIGHSSTWATVSVDTYRRRAARRALNAANALAAELRQSGLTVHLAPEDKPTGRRPYPRCTVDRHADITLCVGERGDTQPLKGVPNLPRSGSPAARDNRARNRRVEIFHYDRPKRVRPKNKPGDRPAPPSKGKPRQTSRPLPICILHCSRTNRPAVAASARRALDGSRIALKRMQSLAKMSEPQRRKAWDNGPERKWFGRYSRAKRAPFAFVTKTVRWINEILEGSPSAGTTPCRDRLNHLTIECFEPSGLLPSDHRCAYLEDEVDDLRKAWAKATGSARFRTENHRLEAELVACEQRRGGDHYGYSTPRWNYSYLRPTERNKEPGPFKIALTKAWFQRPPKLSAKGWHEKRDVTIIHEVAHLAGANRHPMIDEVYERRRAVRLARRNPWGARVNAENYGFYTHDLRSL